MIDHDLTSPLYRKEANDAKSTKFHAYRCFSWPFQSFCGVKGKDEIYPKTDH
jgi:hypothetical protein